MEMLILGLIGGLIIGGIIGWLLRPKNADNTLDKQQFEKYKNDSIALKSRLDDASVRLETLDKENKGNISKLAAADSKIAMFEEFRENMKKEFKAITIELLEVQKKSVSEEQSKTIKPVTDQMDKFKEEFDKQIKDMLKNTIDSKASLETELKILKESTGSLQKEAKDLTDALRGQSKLQGTWAEGQIKKIFDMNGLETPRDYTVQEYFKDDEHKRFTDFIVKLPGDRNIIIDSKNTLRSYYEYVHENDSEKKKVHLEAYVKATKDRITELSGKAYHDLVGGGRLDFVFMFIPLEHAYLEALQASPDLYDFAFNKNIVLVTSSLLVPVIRVIDNLWNIDKQNKNIEKAVAQLKALYEKYVGFADDYAKLGDQLKTVRNTYDKGVTKLASTGGLHSKFEKMRLTGGLPVLKKLAVDDKPEEKGDDEDE